MTCPECESPLRSIQVEKMINNPECQRWCREGFCSLACFEKNSASQLLGTTTGEPMTCNRQPSADTTSATDSQSIVNSTLPEVKENPKMQMDDALSHEQIKAAAIIKKVATAMMVLAALSIIAQVAFFLVALLAIFVSPMISVICFIGLLMLVVIFLGALKMIKLQSYRFAMTAAILSMIVPIFSLLCLLSLPVGIWALVVLKRSEVKSAFTKGTVAGITGCTNQNPTTPPAQSNTKPTTLGNCPRCGKNPILGVPKSFGFLGAMLMGASSVIIDAIYLTTQGYRCAQCGRLSMDEVPPAFRTKYYVNIGFSCFIVLVILIALAYIASP